MARQRRTFSTEFKLDTARLVIEQGYFPTGARLSFYHTKKPYAAAIL